MSFLLERDLLKARLAVADLAYTVSFAIANLTQRMETGSFVEIYTLSLENWNHKDIFEC